MRVLITGRDGQVGFCLNEQLSGKANVLALGRDDLDITDREAVEVAVMDFHPDIIINAAAYTAVDKAEQEVELSYAINRDGPKHLAEAASRVGATILHISTDYVFAGDKQGLYSERDLTNPQGVYGQSKLDGEQSVIEACNKHIILRTAWVFGENGNNFVRTMLRLGKERDTLGIVGDQFGGPTFAGDIASALIKIATVIHSGKPVEYGIYHLSGLPHVSWFEFAKEIFSNAKSQGVLENVPQLNRITTADFPTPAKRPANSKLDCNKIQIEFDIDPSDWNDALDRIHEYK